MRLDQKVALVKETILYKGWSTLKQFLVHYTREDGKIEHQIREIYDSGDGAAVLMFDPDARKILLIRQFRLAALLNGHENGFIVECCAGMLDALHPEAAIIKEIFEETGYTVQHVNKIYEAFATPGAHMEKIHFFTCAFQWQDKSHAGGGDIAEQEEIFIECYDYADVSGLLRNGNIVDCKTIVLLQWALLHLIDN
ncbi:MAG: NUDIX domain-containing protein [Saprospiraceae bacterium]